MKPSFRRRSGWTDCTQTGQLRRRGHPRLGADSLRLLSRDAGALGARDQSGWNRGVCSPGSTKRRRERCCVLTSLLLLCGRARRLLCGGVAVCALKEGLVAEDLGVWRRRRWVRGAQGSVGSGSCLFVLKARQAVPRRGCASHTPHGAALRQGCSSACGGPTRQCRDALRVRRRKPEKQSTLLSTKAHVLNGRTSLKSRIMALPTGCASTRGSHAQGASDASSRSRRLRPPFAEAPTAPWYTAYGHTQTDTTSSESVARWRIHAVRVCVCTRARSRGGGASGSCMPPPPC